jgi:hypothetical protein
MTHADANAPSERDVPLTKGISPMAKVLMALALALVFMQGFFTVVSSGFGRQPPAEAIKVKLPAQNSP